jgi:hypothetical protein
MIRFHLGIYEHATFHCAQRYFDVIDELSMPCRTASPVQLRTEESAAAEM